MKYVIHKKKLQDDGDQPEVEGTELIEKNSETISETPNTQTRIKLPNPFRKSKVEEDGKWYFIIKQRNLTLFISLLNPIKMFSLNVTVNIYF